METLLTAVILAALIIAMIYALGMVIALGAIEELFKN